MSVRASAVAEVQTRIGHVFADPALLDRALTHASVGQGARKVGDNERLEFLGDRVLGLLVAEALMRRYPEATEGELTPRLHALVRFETCAGAAERAGVAPALRLSAGESKTGGRAKQKVLADAAEALLGAVYLDGGLDAARRVLERLWREELESVDEALEARDSKSALQRWALGRGRALPAYRVLERTGPDHAPTFSVEAAVEGVEPAQGFGRSRMEAEKAAALALLTRENLL